MRVEARVKGKEERRPPVWCSIREDFDRERVCFP